MKKEGDKRKVKTKEGQSKMVERQEQHNNFASCYIVWLRSGKM
jgi:hypothetical protein